MISEHMINENSGDHMVGGPGCIVEVDVAQYGRAIVIKHKNCPPS